MTTNVTTFQLFILRTEERRRKSDRPRQDVAGANMVELAKHEHSKEKTITRVKRLMLFVT